MKQILQKGDKIGLVSCSNGYDLNKKNDISNLVNLLSRMNLKVALSNSLYKDINNNTHEPINRAQDLMKMYLDKDIKAIFDISGGDLANELLEILDFDLITNNSKPFFGYSDLTVILNSIYKKTNTPSYNYQIRNLVRDNTNTQVMNFSNTLLEGKNDLYNFKYYWVNGNQMEGIVVGGNIRCLLKLAGTEYMPNFNEKLLFLEAFSGDINKIATYIAQLNQLGAFNKIKGLILGEFTEYEKNKNNIKIEDLIKDKIKSNIPIIKTEELGHSSNSKAIPIGKLMKFD
ncbi:MAG: LD-carboxypeptidase [Clostridiales bacterium]|nr:LD-carboxypeptidase [Clostridiales bacterium]